jgi:hypothetical protein
MPAPSGNRSTCRMGGGFRISNPRKSIKPASIVFHVTGAASKVIHWPATSSITTNCGSLIPERRAATVAAGIPTAIDNAASAAKMIDCQSGLIHCPRMYQVTTAAADPQVPGPGRSRPRPKNVAISTDKENELELPCARTTCCVPESVFILGVPRTRTVCDMRGIGNLVGDVVHRRRNYILAAGPLPQVDHPAALAAERKVFRFRGDRTFTDGALKFDRPFSSHALILV